MALTETQEIVTSLHKGKPYRFPGDFTVTRMNRRSDSFDWFLVESDGAAEVSCSFTRAAAIVDEGRGYWRRYGERRAALEEQDEHPAKTGYADWARNLSDANLEVTLKQDRARREERPRGTKDDPFRAASEFSDPAVKDADTDARIEALAAEHERRLEEWAESVRARPHTLSRPSQLAERYAPAGSAA